MSGRDYVNPEQLKLFMSANEIEAGYSPLYSDRDMTVSGWRETDEQLWSRKYSEAGRDGTGPSVMHHGVVDPVTLSTDEREYDDDKPQILGGHHRIAVMRQNKPDELMPVIHYENVDALVAAYNEDGDDMPYRYT